MSVECFSVFQYVNKCLPHCCDFSRYRIKTDCRKSGKHMFGSFCEVWVIRFTIESFCAGFSHQLADKIRKVLHVFVVASFYK